MDIVAVVPARGGSKGLPRKNLRLLGGLPLLAHAIRQARSARTVQRVIVSTDDSEIAEVALAEGAEVPFLRPPEFATDDATDLVVFRHLLEFLQTAEGRVPELLVQVRATSPLRRPAVIDLAVEKMLQHPDADSLRSVSLAPFTPYKMWTLRPDTVLEPVLRLAGVADWYDSPRQRLPDVFAQDGLVDVVRPATVLGQNSMAGRRILGLLHPDPAVDIDDIDSLLRAEAALAKAEPKHPGGIGIVQGRLTPSWNGELQCFPRERWVEEFSSAAALRYDHVELIIDRQYNSDNPLWTAEGRTLLRETVACTGTGSPTACLDYLIEHDVRMAEHGAWVERLAPVLAEVGVSLVVLPLFEASAARWPLSVEIVAALRRIGDVFGRCGIRVCLETTLPGAEMFELLGRLGHSNVGACYDIGNATALGHRTVPDVALLGPSIWHVHVKDKSIDGQNVLLGQGAADLAGVFTQLAADGYAGAFTLEAPRGADPLVTARRHRGFIESLIKEAQGRWV